MKYKVSVITPFHNIDMGMFENAYKSVQAQTIGFENIQWIVIVHNSEPHYMADLQQMLGAHDNVVLKELNNDAKTPSSPRNYGVTFATAPYIGYLDGDDRYLPDCLEVACREAEQTKSQVVTFRRIYEHETKVISQVQSKMIWNLTEPRIVLERGNWNDNDVFSAVDGFVTSRLFERQFLIDRNITFDETVLYAEDWFYSIQAMAQADRICFLTQLVGYVYFINQGSLVQTWDKDGSILVKYAEGFKKIIDAALDYGISMQVFAQMLCFVESRYILCSHNITLAQRQKIKELLAPYINKFKILPPSKTTPEILREMVFRMPGEIILNPDDPQNNTYAIDVLDGMNELMEILRANADTDYGLAHNFKSIDTLKGYQYRTPLSNYDNYEPYIKLQTCVGEDNIIVHDKIDRYFELPDGRLLPCTQHHFAPYTEAFASLLQGHHNLLIATSVPVSRKTNDFAEVDTLESMLVKDYFFHDFYVGGKQQASFSAPFTSFFLQQKEKNYFSIMRSALADPDIDQIAALTTVQVVEAFRILEQHWQQMTYQLRTEDGNGKRADEVEKILESGFDEPIAKKLWRKLDHIVAFGAGELYESCNEMKRYTGDIPHNHGYYFTEETIFGKAVADDSNLFECIRNNNFYELIPIKGEDNSSPIRFSEANIGEPYQLVVTNRAGLYRYVTDHIVCPKEVNHNQIRFTIY